MPWKKSIHTETWVYVPLVIMCLKNKVIKTTDTQVYRDGSNKPSLAPQIELSIFPTNLSPKKCRTIWGLRRLTQHLGGFLHLENIGRKDSVPYQYKITKI